MYILTSKYFPTDSWPDDYFPALPEGVVDIQYKEVVEFSLAIAATAEFEVVLPNDASVDVVSTDIIVSGAGTSTVDGTYIFVDMFGSYPRYAKSPTELIYWKANSWRIYDSGGLRYYAVNTEPTPDLSPLWKKNTGLLPVPTVTAGATATLTEVAAFTVEMPMLVEMEVYEELSA